MPTRPPNPPAWLAPGTEPSTALKAAGWIAGMVLPADAINWFWSVVSAWLDLAATGYTDLEDAAAAEVGDVFVVFEDDLAFEPGTTAALQSSLSSPKDVAAGSNVVITTSGSGVSLRVRVYDRSLVLLRECTPSTTPTASARVWTDGESILYAHDNYVECFEVSDGSSRWEYDHGGTVHDVCSDGTYAYLVGAAGTGTKHLRAISMVTGSAVWSFDHGATLFAVTTNGARVFVAGNASSHATGAVARSVAATDGRGATSEGGIGVDARQWDTTALTGVISRGLACDEHRLYAARDLGASTARDVYALAAALQIQTVNGPTSDLEAIAVDQDYVYTVGNAQIRCYRKPDFEALVWAQTYISPDGVASDGSRLWVVDNATAELSGHYRGNAPGLWTRIDPSGDRFGAYRQLVIPYRGA